MLFGAVVVAAARAVSVVCGRDIGVDVSKMLLLLLVLMLLLLVFVVC